MRQLICEFKAWERRRAIARSIAQAHQEVGYYLKRGDLASAMARFRWWDELLLKRHGAWWVQDARELSHQ